MIPNLCNFCRAPIAKRTCLDNRVEVIYECGSDASSSSNPNMAGEVSVINNKCTFIPPPGVPEDPEDWTDFYKNETYEVSAYNAHLQMMGDRFQWLHELGDAYKALVDDLRKSEPMEHETLLLVQTCITCRTELVTAFRALARGYSNDCRLKTRLAVEYAIFAARAVEKPGSAEIWLAAGSSDRGWKRYRDSFKIHYLLEKEDAWKALADLKAPLKRLIDDYAHLSQFTHATVLSSGLQTSGNQVTLKTNFVEKYTEFQFLSIFGELVNVHLDLVDLMVKLAKFLKMDVRSEIAVLVKQLEEEVNTMFEELDELSKDLPLGEASNI